MPLITAVLAAGKSSRREIEAVIPGARRDSRRGAMRRSVFSLPFFALLSLGCHSAGPYGYAREYQPLSAEKSAVAGAREFDPVMAERDKEDWKKGSVTLFGIVTGR